MKLRRDVLILIALSCCAIPLPACSTVSIRVTAHTRPVVDLGLTKIAVLPFSGANGDQVGALMHGVLGEAGCIDLVERRQIQKVIDEQGLQRTALFDTEAAVKIGKLTGALHVLLGNVITYSAKETAETRFEQDFLGWVLGDREGEPRLVPYTYYTMNADVTVHFRVVDVETGMLVRGASKNISRGFRRHSRDRSKLGTMSGVLAGLAEEACEEFRERICGSVMEVKRQFLKSDSDSAKSEALVARGLKLLRAGDTEGAEQAFRNALEHDAEHAAALFDLAIVLALQGRVREAEEYALKALRAEPENECIIEGKNWVASLPR